MLCIRIRIYLAADPDFRSMKLTNINKYTGTWFPAFLKVFCTFVGTFFLLKTYLKIIGFSIPFPHPPNMCPGLSRSRPLWCPCCRWPGPCSTRGGGAAHPTPAFPSCSSSSRTGGAYSMRGGRRSRRWTVESTHLNTYISTYLANACFFHGGRGEGHTGEWTSLRNTIPIYQYLTNEYFSSIRGGRRSHRW